MTAYRGGAIDTWNKSVQSFVDANVFVCPDCGVDLPLDDTDAKQAHYAVCEKRRRHIVDMTSAEARLCVDSIHAHIRHARALILELYERKGWQALGYASWRACVSAEFEQSQTHMYRQLAAAFVEQVIAPDSPIGEIPESHLRPITGLTETQSQIVWQVVEDTAPAGKVTAAHVKSVVNIISEITATSALDDGTGNQIPIAQATTAHLKAAITEETYERMQRQKAHIEANSKRKTRLLHTVEFDAMSEFDLANLSLTMKRQMVGKHIQIVIKEVEE